MKLVRFAERCGMFFRVLLEEDAGSWLICYDEPAAPFFVTKEELGQYQRAQTPEGFEPDAAVRTGAEQERLDLLQPLLENEACIREKKLRKTVAQTIAQTYHTTVRRIISLYYRYLATGILIRKRHREPVRNAEFEWAIQTFYFSAKRLSLRGAYEMMLVQRYAGEDGSLPEEYPSWSSFQHYFYRHNFHKKPQKSIAREGLFDYQRNERQLYGTVAQWQDQVGAYQMDATQADIYLVSRFDRSKIIGRPYLYLAVDSRTQLIAGIYVGMEAGEQAVAACLVNAACDKTAYCARYGVTIAEADWPSRGMPRQVVTDKGREFIGSRMKEMCCRYGIELQSPPPFRPDQKGCVEKAFDLLQQRYKPLLRGRGVIEADAQERWATDYREQAVLDLDDFNQIILRCVVYLNSARVLSCGKTPAQLWTESGQDLLMVDDQELYLMGLPREQGKLSRKGIRYAGAWYAPDERDVLAQGERCVLAVDPNDRTYIYLVRQGGYHRCTLTGASRQYWGMAQQEAEALRRQEQEQAAAARKAQTEAGVMLVREINSLIEKRKRGD